MTAKEVKERLGLVPHPREGGWYVRTYEAAEMLEPGYAGTRYVGSRRMATAIYYLLEADTFSEIHRLSSDEIFHFYAGDPVEMLQLFTGGDAHVLCIGNDLAKQEQPQVLVPKGVWQGSRLAAGGEWALLGCTVSPGFEFEDYTSGDRTTLIAEWPKQADLIRSLTREN